MAEKSGIKFLKFYLQKLKSFFLSKDILSFLLFFALSATFWFVNALGKERETTVSIPIRYVGVPQNIVITNQPPTSILLKVKDQGIRLFSYSNSSITPLTIDLNRVFYEKGEILFTSDQLSGRISRYMRMQPTTTVLEILPDSILIQYEKLSQRKLPIKLVSNIELTPQYMLSDKIILSPGMVTVFGPKRLIDTLKSINTESFDLQNVNDTNSYRCKLKPIQSVRFSTNEIKLTLFVEQFTEKKVQIPISAINCPNNLFIRTFPAVVNATYIVGLSKFNNQIRNDIEVYLDYKELIMDNLGKQTLKIKNNKSYISNIRISPQEVEFILEKK
jgi:hypothetical protein